MGFDEDTVIANQSRKPQPTGARSVDQGEGELRLSSA